MNNELRWKIISLPHFLDNRGSIGVVEARKDIPFDIKRLYYLFDVPHNALRGAHAHKELQQLIICMGGSFEIELDDGVMKETVFMNNPTVGLYINNLVWRDLKNFSGGSICCVLASDYYDESDYYRSYDDFMRAIK